VGFLSATSGVIRPLSFGGQFASCGHPTRGDATARGRGEGFGEMIVCGLGGSQILVVDPSGNLAELFPI
jgi:hypothetical protein